MQIASMQNNCVGAVKTPCRYFPEVQPFLLMILEHKSIDVFIAHFTFSTGWQGKRKRGSSRESNRKV